MSSDSAPGRDTLRRIVGCVFSLCMSHYRSFIELQSWKKLKWRLGLILYFCERLRPRAFKWFVQGHKTNKWPSQNQTSRSSGSLLSGFFSLDRAYFQQISFETQHLRSMVNLLHACLSSPNWAFLLGFITGKMKAHGCVSHRSPVLDLPAEDSVNTHQEAGGGFRRWLLLSSS